MNITLVKAVIALVPTGVLLIRTASFICHQPNAARVLQLCGSACLMIVVLTHIAEGLQVLSFMGWGEINSVGHYLDLSSLALGVMLLSVGYLMASRRAS